MQVRRAALTGVRELSFERIEVDDENLASTALSARTLCSAVSVGTEVAAYIGAPPLRPGPIYPRRVGYCNVATVERVGGEVAGIKPGDRVLTHQSHQSGFVCDQAEVLAVLDDDLDPETASVAYLAHLGLSALQKSRFQTGETVAVLGLGPIGLATVGVLRALGGMALALGNDDARMTKARTMGANWAFDSRAPDLAQEVAAATGNQGPDVIVTTTNLWAGWKTALEIARFQTRIAVLGFPGRSEGPPEFNPLDSAHFYDKQLSILAAGQTEDAAAAPVAPLLRKNVGTILKLLSEGRLDLRPLITDRVSWEELPSIYDRAARHDKSLVAAVLNWTP
jgi:threonine dehydrogenase-like Zn-dependent dehydrogenase